MNTTTRHHRTTDARTPIHGIERPRRFRELFCEAHGCSEKDYAPKLFWRCLHRKSFFWSAIVYAVNPGFFAPDFNLIYNIGEAVDYKEFRREILEYQRLLRSPEWSLKAKWRMRVSASRLTKLRFNDRPDSRLLNPATNLNGTH